MVNISGSNGLLPDGVKPLPKSILTKYQRGLVAFTLRQFLLEMLNISIFGMCLKTTDLRLQTHLPGTYELKLKDKLVVFMKLQPNVLPEGPIYSPTIPHMTSGPWFDIKL